MSQYPIDNALIQRVSTRNGNRGDKELFDPAVCLTPGTVEQSPCCRDDAGDGYEGPKTSDIQVGEGWPVGSDNAEQALHGRLSESESRDGPSGVERLGHGLGFRGSIGPMKKVGTGKRGRMNDKRHAESDQLKVPIFGKRGLNWQDKH